MIKRRNIILRDGGSGYRTYVFEESIRHYTIDRKGQGYKEVISLSKLRPSAKDVAYVTSLLEGLRTIFKVS